MNKKMLSVTLSCIVATMAVTAAITIAVFNSDFAHKTIDYFSFAAAFFLIAEGVYKIVRYRHETYFPNHFLRHARVLIGVCVFTIHLMQYVYGV